jgi:hypothetical protein
VVHRFRPGEARSEGENVKVSWDQVHAWRLRRQFLDPLGDADAVDVIGRLCGVQAQVASSAELAVRIRQAEPEAAAVERGLAGRRSSWTGAGSPACGN